MNLRNCNRHFFRCLVIAFLGLSFCPLPLKATGQQVTVLTWNIKFLPRILAHIHHYPMKRVPLIAAQLNALPYDIVVLQEAFDRSCNRKLKKLLHEKYPYCIGPANQKGGFKISSGVMIFSRYPLKWLGEVDFETCEKEDCMARKGGLLVEADVQGRRLQILGTHMEAGGSDALKTSQLVELGGLLDRFAESGVPQLACGDFNIASDNSRLYPYILYLLKAEDGPLTGELKYTSDHLLNDMESYNPSRRHLIDYILYRGNGVQPVSVTRQVVRHTQRWHKKHEDLSDHLAVRMDLVF